MDGVFLGWVNEWGSVEHISMGKVPLCQCHPFSILTLFIQSILFGVVSEIVVMLKNEILLQCSFLCRGQQIFFPPQLSARWYLELFIFLLQPDRSFCPWWREAHSMMLSFCLPADTIFCGFEGCEVKHLLWCTHWVTVHWWAVCQSFL